MAVGEGIQKQEKYGTEREREIDEELRPIRLLKAPMEKLLSQMRDGIERGEYQLLIGDDASGRIPTLLFSKVLKAIYGSRGYNPPETIFFAGASYSENDAKVFQQRVDRLKKFQGRVHKALVVTDTIATGRSVKGIARALESAGFSFDIAAVGHVRSGEVLRQQQEEIGGRIFVGQEGTPMIYGKRGLSGVKKYEGRLYAERMETENGEVLDAPTKGVKVREARKEVNELSQKLIKWFERGPGGSSGRTR